VDLSSVDILLDGDAALLPQLGKSPPQFWGPGYCGQTARWTMMPLGVDVSLGPGDIVLDGDPAPLKRGTAPQFSALFYCGQKVGWIKMPVATAVDLDPGHIVVDGEWGSSFPGRCTEAPSFSARVYCGHTVANLSYC